MDKRDQKPTGAGAATADGVACETECHANLIHLRESLVDAQPGPGLG